MIVPNKGETEMRKMTKRKLAFVRFALAMSTHLSNFVLNANIWNRSHSALHKAHRHRDRCTLTFGTFSRLTDRSLRLQNERAEFFNFIHQGHPWEPQHLSKSFSQESFRPIREWDVIRFPCAVYIAEQQVNYAWWVERCARAHTQHKRIID